MDPAAMTPEEQIARYDEIIAIVAEEPTDDAGKIGQFVQISGIVNRPAEGAAEEDPAEDVEDEAVAEEEEEAPADEEEEDEDEAKAKAKSKKGKVKANPHATAISGSKEGKANPAAALEAINAGLTLKQFKAMAPSLGKKSNFASRMDNESGSQRLGADSPDGKGKKGKVVQLKPASEYYAAAQGGARANKK